MDSWNMGDENMRDENVKETSLREVAYDNVIREGSVFGNTAAAISSAPAVDCSRVVEFFLEDTPEEEGFSVQDIPLLSGVDWLYSGGGSAFFETAPPPEEGFMWGMLLTQSVDHPAIVGAISETADVYGLDCDITEGDPGLVLIEAGAVERAGMLVTADKPLGDDRREEFYDTLFSEIVDLEDLRCVLQLTFFVELRSGLGDGHGTLLEPAMMFYLAVDMGGHIVSFGGPNDEIKLFAPGVGDLAQLEDNAEFAGEAQRPLMLAVLFSLACAGAAGRARGPASPRLIPGGSDSLGPTYSLQGEGLLRALDVEGRATDLGLSHALTVCRDQFDTR